MLGCEEISILERQRAIFERLYQCQQQLSSLPNQNLAHFNSLISEHIMDCSQVQNFPIKIDPQLDESSRSLNMFGSEQKTWAGSDFANNSLELAHQSLSTLSNSSMTKTSTKKRKAEVCKFFFLLMVVSELICTHYNYSCCLPLARYIVYAGAELPSSFGFKHYIYL